MSENNLTEKTNSVSPDEPTTDLTEKDLADVARFVDAGLPGVTSVDGAKMTRIMDLYLSGKTYRQISVITRINKSLILYLSNRFNWYALRRDYLEDLEQSVRGRVVESNVISQDFLLQLIQFWQKRIGSKMNEYLATGNEQFANDIDLKEVDKLLKTIAMLREISTNKEGSPKAPTVGLNLGEGVTITKKSNNEVEITPKNAAIGSVLKQLADLKREEEKRDKEVPKRDIINNNLDKGDDNVNKTKT